MPTMPISQALALARDHLNKGRPLEAIEICRVILEAAPETAEAYVLLSSIAQVSGNLPMGIDFAQRAVALAPHDPRCYVELASAQRASGAVAEAESTARIALAIRPDSAEAENMLALLFESQGRWAEAEAAFGRALAIKPDYVDAMTRFSMFLGDQGRREEAEHYARRALQIQPDHATAANTLGNILQLTVRMEESEAVYRQALAAAPHFPEAHTNLGSVLQAMGRLDEAYTSYKRTLELRPSFSGAHSNLLACEQCLPDVTLEKLAAAHALWEERHGAPLRSTWRPHENRRDPDRPLRIGFLSADLGRHPVGYFTVRMFEALDREQFHNFCYSDRVGADDITNRIQAVMHVWRDLRGLSDVQVAELIRADGIDILFDLAGHATARLPVFARKPAPIQISWIGYVGTTGLASMDYVLGDWHQIHEGDERYYAERALRLPEGYVCYEAPEYAPPVAPLPALENGFVTFGNFNRLAKINAEVVAAWSEIMRRVSGSRMVVMFRGLEGPATRKRYWDMFAGNGVDPGRVDLLGGVSHPEMLANYGRVDIALDTFPYSGGLITCEALWMGVPVVTFPGKTFAGRHSVSHVTNAGFPELVARDRAEYVELAARLAADLPRLAELRAAMRPRMAASPLCDGPRFAAHFMAMLRDVWRRWVEEGQRPAPLPAPPPARPASAPLLNLPPWTIEGLSQAGQHLQAGRLNEAQAACARLLESDPNLAPALRILGLVLWARGDTKQALAYVARAIELHPGIAEWYDNLGALYGMLGRVPEAEAACRESVRIEPGSPTAWNNLGLALRSQRRMEEAEEAHRRALALDPGSAETHLNLGTVMLAMGRREEAVEEYQRSLAIDPNRSEVASNLLLTLQYRPGITPAELAEAHASWDARYGAPLRSQWCKHPNPPDPGRRLRLGFVSQDFNNHPAGFLFVRLLESLDRRQVETFCYSDVKQDDEMTRRLRPLPDHWLDLGPRDHEQVARKIREDGIDVLFDLSGHTAGNRLPAFARKPAPIQITWIGYVGTTGLEAMDYVLADRYQVPPEAERYYREKVLRMPDGYVCWCPPSPSPDIAPLPAQIRGHVTFGSFNNPAKINDEVLRAWADVLRRVPGSRLLMKYQGLDGPSTRQRLIATIARHGIEPGRVELLGWSNHFDMLRHYQQVDVALDPFPYSGGVTTCEALWMGVPVITCPGETFASRHSLSHLSNVGLTETIAGDLGQYADLAVALAGDLPRLAALRARLRGQMLASPLCDAPRFAANFLQLIRQVWREWCAAQ